MLQGAILYLSRVFTIILNKSEGWGFFYWRLDDLIVMR